MELFKYQGAGNDFLIADNRNGELHLTEADIQSLCDRRYGIGADGLMLLESEPGYDFRMVYYNSDGSGGMMCGNGGRCIAAFANRCGIKGCNFIGADGPHNAEILRQDGNTSIVRLRMRDVTDIKDYNQQGGCFLDTGTRHFVKPVKGVSNYDIIGEGRFIRYSALFEPQGVNANFIEPAGDVLKVRTYEKGVEDETYACGTGITASAIAAWHMGIKDGCTVTPYGPGESDVMVHYEVQALRDKLAVDFRPTANGATDVWLTGPATFVAEIKTK